MNYKIVNKIFGIVIIVSNLLLFIPLSIKNIYSGGGTMGFGLIAIPFLLIIHSFLIPACLAFKSKYNTFEQTIINGICVAIIVALLYFMILL